MLIDDLFERKSLACLLRSNEFCSTGATHIKPSYFEGAMRQNMAKMALDFFDRYKTTITSMAFVQEITKLVLAGTIKKAEAGRYGAELKALQGLDISDWKYVLDNVMSFVRNRETRALIEDAVKRFLPRNDFESIDKAWGKIARIGSTLSVEPIDYFEDAEIEKRRQRREDEKSNRIRGISTGIKKLDDAMPKGGWVPKELYSISGAPKRGKTTALLWFAYCAAMQGFNAMYFTCEVSHEVIEDRLDAMIAEVSIKHLPDEIVKVADAVKTKKPTGKVFIYEYPTKRLTVTEIERQARRLVLEKGVQIDMIVDDYAGINKARRSLNDPLKEEAEIMEDLRSLAYTFHVPVLTGNQINRTGANKALVKGTDTAGTFEKIMIVDGNITISGTDDEARDGLLRIHLSDMRNAPSRTFKIKTAFNLGRFYKEFVEEEV